MGVYDIGKLVEQRFYSPSVGHQVIYNLRPGLVQALIPDTRAPKFDFLACVLFRAAESIDHTDLTDMCASLFEQPGSPIHRNEIHFVNEDENPGIWRILMQCRDDRSIVDQISVEFSGLDIEDEDQNRDRGKDVRSLVGQVALSEAILSARAVSGRFEWSTVGH